HALDDPDLRVVREALHRFLRAHEPYPAVVVDRHWNIVAMNDGVALLSEGVAPELLEPPVNALRVTLHPRGMAPRIANFAEWSSHLLERLRRELELSADEQLRELCDELAAYPGVVTGRESGELRHDILLPLRLRHEDADLELFSTVTTFGTPLDITLSELAIEAFYPADERTAAVLAGAG